MFEGFRFAYDQGRSQREIARPLGLSQRTVNECLRRFQAAGLVWPLPPEVDEAAVDARLFASDAVPTGGRAVPDSAAIHAAQTEWRDPAAPLARVQGADAGQLPIHAVHDH